MIFAQQKFYFMYLNLLKHFFVCIWLSYFVSCLGRSQVINLKFIYLFIYCCLFAFSRAAPLAYGGSQARGSIGAIATVLHHSHNNTGSELHLRPTPQLTTTRDPRLTEQGQGSNPQPHGSESESLTTVPPRKLLNLKFIRKFFLFLSRPLWSYAPL